MIYLTNRDGGKTDEEGHYQFLAAGFNGNVLKGLTLVQTNPLGMKLNLTAGNARIPYGGYAYSAFVQEGETEEVQIGTANPSNPRIDRVVMYIDRAMARQTVNPNNPGIAKIAVVAGTPAGTPVRPSDVSVNAAVGNNPWINLADVRVNTGVTQITTSNVTDKRVMASAVLAPNAVTADKTAFGGNYSTAEQDTGFTWIDGKTIYKRTFTGTITADSSARSVNNISIGATISNLISVEGYVMTSSTSSMPIGAFWANSNASFITNYASIQQSSATSFNLITLNDTARTSQPYAVVLYYTKS